MVEAQLQEHGEAGLHRNEAAMPRTPLFSDAIALRT